MGQGHGHATVFIRKSSHRSPSQRPRSWLQLLSLRGGLQKSSLHRQQGPLPTGCQVYQPRQPPDQHGPGAALSRHVPTSAAIQRMLELRVMVTGRRSFIALVDRTLDSGLMTPTKASYTSLITADSPRSTNTMQ